MKCPSCGAENPDSAQYCNLCFAATGFESPEYTEPSPVGEGFTPDYPSSFTSPGSASQDDGGLIPRGEPLDTPLDIGEYGVLSGAPVMEAPPMSYPPVAVAVRTFEWGKAIIDCVFIAMTAAAMSVALELFFSFIGVGMMTSGAITGGLIIVFLALMIPVAFAGFASGYRAEAYGWVVGLISVALWAFIFRPVYFAFLSWLLTDRFGFTYLFSRSSIAFTLGLFLPAGAFLGWLGEKRATTGLSL